MAWALGGAGARVKFFVKFQDNKGQSPLYRQFDAFWDTDLATTVANILTYLPVIADISGMLVEEAHVQLNITDSAAVGAEAGSTRFENGIFTLDLDQSGQGQSPFGNVQIPYPKATLRVNPTGAGYWQIDTAAQEVIDLVALYTSGTDLLVNDGQFADSLSGAKVVPKRGKVKTS